MVRILRHSDLSFHPFHSLLFPTPHEIKLFVRHNGFIQVYIKGDTLTWAGQAFCFQEEFVRSPRWIIYCKKQSHRQDGINSCYSAHQPLDGVLESLEFVKPLRFMTHVSEESGSVTQQFQCPSSELLYSLENFQRVHG